MSDTKKVQAGSSPAFPSLLTPPLNHPPGSPASQGKLQFDLWDGAPHVPQMYDWSPLRSLISKHGLRNSLLVAPMPTASTSQILGVNEVRETRVGKRQQ